MKLEIEITKKQRAFIEARETEVLFGGAAGGGKSYGQLVDALLYALKYPTSKQAQSRLESKRRMKNVAYERLYKLIFQHYLAFCGGAKQLAYKDGYGQVRYQRFDKNDFIYTTENGVREYFDRLLFSVDTDLYAEYEREALWAKNLENLTSGTLGDKENPMTLLRYWQFQERAHYPNAKENVEYFKRVLTERIARRHLKKHFTTSPLSFVI